MRWLRVPICLLRGHRWQVRGPIDSQGVFDPVNGWAYEHRCERCWVHRYTNVGD